MTGTIKRLVKDKGFGFIATAELPKDVFFHKNSVTAPTFDELNEGETVTFETADSPKGLNAINVQRAQ